MRIFLLKLLVGIAIGLFGLVIKAMNGGTIGYDVPSLIAMTMLFLSSVIIVNGIVDIYVHYSAGEKPWWEGNEL